MELCRCCLLEGNIGLDSFTDKNIIEILEFLGIFFKIKNNFPINICNSCDLKLKEFGNFRQQCLQTEITLKDIFQSPDFIKKEDGCESVLPNLPENNAEGTQTRRRKKLAKHTESPNTSHQYEEVKKEEIPLIDPLNYDREFAENNIEQSAENVKITSKINLCKINKKLQENFEELTGPANEISNSEDCSVSDDQSVEDNDDNRNSETSPKFVIKRRTKVLTRTYNPARKYKFPFECRICKRGFRIQEMLDGHLREHEGGSAAICEYCNNGYSNWSGLRQHIKRCHMDEMKYRCECGEIFLFERSFEKHRASHYGPQKYICETCGKPFLDQFDLKRHFLVHTDERPFECKTCNKTFKCENDLRAHEFRHTGIRKFPCEVCGKAFVRRPELRTHMLIHTLVKAYKCTLCEKDFRYKNQLDVHMRTHTGETPFKCEICGKAFIQKSALNTHAKTHLRNETLF